MLVAKCRLELRDDIKIPLPGRFSVNLTSLSGHKDYFAPSRRSQIPSKIDRPSVTFFVLCTLSKAVKKLSGKILQSLITALDEVKAANSVEELTDCKKIETLNNVYRIRIGSKRAFFVLHIEIDGDLVKFEYLLNRGEAYHKKNMDNLRRKDV